MFHQQLNINKEPKGTFTKCVKFNFKVLGKFLLTMRLTFALVKRIFVMFTVTLKIARFPIHLRNKLPIHLVIGFKKVKFEENHCMFRFLNTLNRLMGKNNVVYLKLIHTTFFFKNH